MSQSFALSRIMKYVLKLNTGRARSNELRGTSMAVFATFNAVIGAASGPIIIATVSDHFFNATIGHGMAAVMVAACPLAALMLAFAFRAMREAVRESER